MGKVVVSTIDGLYDEKAEAVTCNLADVRSCLLRTHRFINASLYFTPLGTQYHIAIENPAPREGFGSAWGAGYGGIRYCEQCKLIDCIHLWEHPETCYRIEQDRYYADEFSVARCRICGRRILRDRCSVTSPDQAALNLINEVAVALGHTKYAEGKYGSGWYLELPVAVSRLIEKRGAQYAREYAVSCFAAGDCSSASLSKPQHPSHKGACNGKDSSNDHGVRA